MRFLRLPPADVLGRRIPYGLARVRQIDRRTIQLIPFRHLGCIALDNLMSFLGRPGDFLLVLRDRELVHSGLEIRL